MYIASFLNNCNEIVLLSAETIEKLNSEMVAWHAVPENAFSDNADNIVVYQLVKTSAGPKLEQVTDFYVNLVPQVKAW